MTTVCIDCKQQPGDFHVAPIGIVATATPRNFTPTAKAWTDACNRLVFTATT